MYLQIYGKCTEVGTVEICSLVRNKFLLTQDKKKEGKSKE